MSALPNDAKIAAVQVVAWRRLGPAGRMRVAAEMSDDTRRVSEEKLRRGAPDLTRRPSPSVSLEDALSRLVGLLDATGVPHMLAGSLASAAHGVPRPTVDLDIVIDPDVAAVDDLLAALEAGGWQVEGGTDAARGDVAARTHVAVVDGLTSWKVDLVVRKERPFSVAEFGRRERLDVLGVGAWVATAEDTIIAKLECSTRAPDLQRRTQHRRDVANVIASRGAELDRAYIERWAVALELQDEWRKVVVAPQ